VGGSKAAGASSGSTDLQLLLRLQMNEAVLLLSLYAFMAQIGTTLALTVCSEYHRVQGVLASYLGQKPVLIL